MPQTAINYGTELFGRSQPWDFFLTGMVPRRFYGSLYQTHETRLFTGHDERSVLWQGHPVWWGAGDGFRCDNGNSGATLAIAEFILTLWLYICESHILVGTSVGRCRRRTLKTISCQILRSVTYMSLITGNHAREKQSRKTFGFTSQLLLGALQSP